jgi:hypothetical protein
VTLEVRKVNFFLFILFCEHIRAGIAFNKNHEEEIYGWQ